MPEPIYLDYAATTPVLPEVADAVREAMLSFAGNASSQHRAGRAASRALEDAREQITELLGGSTARKDRLLFTSGGAESNNHALRGAMPLGGGGHLVTSAIEHPTVTAIAQRLEAEGHAVARLPVTAAGVAEVDRLAELLQPDTRLISLMLGNSETGVLQPVERVVEVVGAHAPGVAVHTDATQAVGRHPVDFGQLGVAMLTFAAHKFHGPPGMGGLLVRGDCQPTPLLAGQADAERPGTPAIALAVGMARALELATANIEVRIAHLRGLRDRLESSLCRTLPEAVVIGADAPRLPHTTCIAFIGYDRQALMMGLDRAGIACSTGSACASGSSEPSPVLTAMGLPEEQVRGALRFSVGGPTTAAQIDESVTRIATVCRRLRGSKEP